MVYLKSDSEIERIRESCRIAAEAMDAVKRELGAGVGTGHLDEVADTFIRSRHAVPSAKGYRGYPRSICISINEVVVHGIPGERQLREGDVLSVDIAVEKAGFHGDMNVSFSIGEIDPEARRLFDTTLKSLNIGIEESHTDNRVGDIGHAIQQCVEAEGFSVVREFCGHGIGRSFHEEPQILHFGMPRTGRRLEPGLVFTIEPMVNAGVPDVTILDDEWTAVTGDGKLSMQFEHTVAVTENGPDVLSKFDDLPF